MKIAVVGLWHLGCVTAACAAEKNHTVFAIDPDAKLIAALKNNCPPISEPGLTELITAQQQNGRLSFSSDFRGVSEAELVWITFDTPVNETDQADVAFVEDHIIKLFPYLNSHSIVLISSQVPVGTTQKIEKLFYAQYPEQKVIFAYSPENLRLGKSINYFLNLDRIVIGLDDERAKAKLTDFLTSFSKQLVWMRVTSAEMTKHALNAFLAVSVTFANEIARLCECVGADAYEVEQGLKSEARIGPGAYLRPGEAFAGGTLARDVNFLCELSQQHQFPTHIFPAILNSNEQHKQWIKATLLGHFPEGLSAKKVTILGLTYKPDTDTLRRSEMVELMSWLQTQEAVVTAYDPAIKQLPVNLKLDAILAENYEQAIAHSEVIILGTRCPEFKGSTEQHLKNIHPKCAFIDATGFLEAIVKQQANFNYYKVGYHDVT